MWLLFGLCATVCAYPSQSGTSLSNIDSLGLPSRTEDTFRIYKRDLPPDILATSVPVSSIHNHNRDPNANDNNFLLRSSSSNVTGIGGFPIYAFPIMSSDLTELLTKTQLDLQTHNNDLSISSYRFNTTTWSFWVTTANTTLQYRAVKAVATRFLKLASTTVAPQDIVSTRVGVILNENTLIAEIAIIPSRSANLSFPDLGNHSLAPFQSNEVFQVTPFGSTCVAQDINDTAALALYLDHHSTIKYQDLPPRSLRTDTLLPRSLPTDILAPLGHTAIQIVYRLWREPVYGLPVEVKLWAIRGAFRVGLFLCSNLLIHELFNPLSPSQIDSMAKSLRDANVYQNATFDTGYYMVGRLMARLVIENIKKNNNPDPMTAMLKLNIAIIEKIVKPLEEMDPNEEVFAMEGEVYGTMSNGTDFGNRTAEHGEGERDLLARWQVSVKDKEEL